MLRKKMKMMRWFRCSSAYLMQTKSEDWLKWRHTWDHFFFFLHIFFLCKKCESYADKPYLHFCSTTNHRHQRNIIYKRHSKRVRWNGTNGTRIAPTAAVERLEQFFLWDMWLSSMAEDLAESNSYRVPPVQMVRREKKGQRHHRYDKIVAHSRRHMLSLCKSKWTNANIFRMHSAHTHISQFWLREKRAQIKKKSNENVG